MTDALRQVIEEARQQIKDKRPDDEVKISVRRLAALVTVASSATEHVPHQATLKRHFAKR